MTTSPEKLYNIAPEGRARLYTGAEIRAAAAEGVRVWLDAGQRFPRIPCRLAANVAGWVTAASDKGGIDQAWAGEFYGSPSTARTEPKPPQRC